MTADASALEIRRLTVDEYHRVVDAGVLDEDEHVELLEGMIVAMPPQGPEHARSVESLNWVLTRALPEGYRVRPQLPLTLPPDNEPEPDLAVVKVDEARSASRHPSTALLVVEVANESIGRDRNTKIAVYARAGIEEYWIVDVRRRRVEVYRGADRDEGRYRTLITVDETGTLAPSAFPDVKLAVREILR